jgi:microcystin-dependent protein
VVPLTFLICDGSSLQRADYPYLFASIGTIYGSVDAQSFNLPDLTDRYIKGTAVNANVITPSDITGTVQFGALTTANLPPVAIPLTGGAYTFSGSMSQSVLRSGPDGESVSNSGGGVTFVNQSGNGTFDGGTVALNSYTISSVNPNQPINVPITTNDFDLRGYTMPYIIKAFPSVVAVV